MNPEITRPTNHILESFNTMTPTERLIYAVTYAHQAWLAHRWLVDAPEGTTIGGMTLEDVDDVLDYWMWQERYAIAMTPTGRDPE